MLSRHPLSKDMLKTSANAQISTLSHLVCKPREQVVALLRKCGLIPAHAHAAVTILDQVSVCRVCERECV